LAPHTIQAPHTNQAPLSKQHPRPTEHPPTPDPTSTQPTQILSRLGFLHLAHRKVTEFGARPAEGGWVGVRVRARVASVINSTISDPPLTHPPNQPTHPPKSTHPITPPSHHPHPPIPPHPPKSTQHRVHGGQEPAGPPLHPLAAPARPGAAAGDPKARCALAPRSPGRRGLAFGFEGVCGLMGYALECSINPHQPPSHPTLNTPNPLHPLKPHP